MGRYKSRNGMERNGTGSRKQDIDFFKFFFKFFKKYSLTIKNDTTVFTWSNTVFTMFLRSSMYSKLLKKMHTMNII